MAVRYATKSGDWSDVSVWDGGSTLPGASDDVHANNFTVNIDQNVTVATLRTTSGSGITVGGEFKVKSGAAVTITVTGGIDASSHNGTDDTQILTIDAGCTVTLAAALKGGSSSGRVACLVDHAGAVVTVQGDVTGGTTSFCSGLRLDNGSVTVASGFVVAAGAGSNGRRGLEVTGGTAVVDAAVFAGTGEGNSVGNTAAVYNNGGTVTVNGDVTGGTSMVSRAAVSAYSGTVIINGKVTGAPSAGAAPVTAIGGTIIVYGPIQGSGGPAVDSTSGTLEVRGPILTSASPAISLGTTAVYGASEIAPFSLSDLAAVTGAQIAAATDG